MNEGRGEYNGPEEVYFFDAKNSDGEIVERVAFIDRQPEMLLRGVASVIEQELSKGNLTFGLNETPEKIDPSCVVKGIDGRFRVEGLYMIADYSELSHPPYQQYDQLYPRQLEKGY